MRLTLNEHFVLYGILLLPGYNKYPNQKLYWAPDNDVSKIEQNSIRLRRSEKIYKSFHIYDNYTYYTNTIR